MDTYSKAVAELAEIEQKLAALAALQKRREQLRAFVDIGRTLYDDGADGAMPQAAAPSPYQPRNGAHIALPRLTVKAQVIEAATRLIAEHGAMQSRHLVEKISFGGTDDGRAGRRERGAGGAVDLGIGGGGQLFLTQLGAVVVGGRRGDEEGERGEGDLVVAAGRR